VYEKQRSGREGAALRRVPVVHTVRNTAPVHFYWFEGGISNLIITPNDLSSTILREWDCVDGKGLIS